MVSLVLEACTNIQCEGLETTGMPLLVVGDGAEQVQQEIGAAAEYIEQSEQLGTGHAVAIAEGHIADDAVVLVVYGDVPLISPATLGQVVAGAGRGALSLLTAEVDDPGGYGRILRDDRNAVVGVVEHRDASPKQRAIHEINTGILALDGRNLKAFVRGLSNDNAASEYYLTDIVAVAVAEGLDIQVCHPADPEEILGANDREQLAVLGLAYRHARARELMRAGATIVDPARIDIRGTVRVGMDVLLDVDLVLQGEVVFGDNVIVEPNSVITDSVIEEGARIRAFSHLESAHVGKDAVVGPYARLRAGSRIGARARVGNFVETKNVELGQGSKANHLTYLGDTRIGPGVNVGAGVVTCNYDGKDKHRTTIKEGAFIGSNASLVAPVTVGAGATVAAGTVITSDVGAGELAVARSKRKSVSDWVRPDQRPDSDNPG